MKIALVHDYIKEFGGAERVLRVLSDMYPKAPIYTAFKVNGSSCAKQFEDRVIIESPWAFLIKWKNLYSPLRFLVPLIWGSMDLSEYDLVITSCSSFFARGFKIKKGAKVIAYCHTPPRFLYGYETSINLQKYFIVRVYATVVNHFLRLFDLHSARMVTKWVVNSETVKARVKKFYRRDAQVVNPPVEVEKIGEASEKIEKGDYFLIVSRLVGAKGLVEAAKAVNVMNLKLKIIGEAVGFSQIKKQLEDIPCVELMGRVSDGRMWQLLAGARGFIALAKDEDFGITVVEAMAAGTPVLAYNGGGFRETILDGVTGILVNSRDEKTLVTDIKRFLKRKWDKDSLRLQSSKFSRSVFEEKMKKIVKDQTD